ncbi:MULTISPECIES: LPS export ABC transporter periplasmic protein LptC [Providencia]|uniref:Lipopolysaccharide export system protein LptC n=1 Tax=Providencia heimbachae ATCC 35613 TaxID=1354272 RepID=A0A1B7JXX3_9GAMM|nr:LPS export ABC transporter periplasmic protein LptC [Providencia heimbachae]MBP6122546.1 LPS export ABC transporter periplasmic protein LptC [Providencia sp.]MDD9340932.1 LPS export ABC transporter periplasmic protein LptC [Providencia heimbachae]NIH23867.1 LPS export ABC transporter periplasmic protein LptC [Providencia heimbachae]OAT52742.1 YrbK family protein [Providencia heimbachae ATCC 35613]QCJ71313.1 LPS export ABC transporter periplasmic protein LptC [Providencia heimbachae]
MSNTKKWLIIILSLIVLGLIGWNLSGSDSGQTTGSVINDGQPNYQTDDSVTFVYNPAGDLAYKLIATKIDNYTESKITWFSQPVLTTYNEAGVPTWTVKAFKARLTSDRVLYLYSDVQVDSLNKESQIQQITTESAVVNLTTQDVSSEDKVTITGHGLNSTGLKMKGNLRTRTAELIEDVKTYYELQPKEQQK